MKPTIVILGGGINGAAIARELALSGVSIWVVEQSDLCHGATAYSSRLVHGGLRYLEFGEFDLVRESLAERTRLLRLAPQFVQPLRLFVPVRKRAAGWLASAARFLRLPAGSQTPERGLWLVRAGLWFYDRYARDKSLPRHRVLSLPNQAAPPVDASVFRWLCAYYDAQIRYPERFTQALLADARQICADRGAEFHVFTRHTARLSRAGLTVSPVDESTEQAEPAETSRWEEIVQPAAIVNATGAWVDETLQRLPLESERLMGGTKGSHLFTFHAGLRAALEAGGIYTEAPDGRPVFILPLAGGALIGTTDLPYTGDPSAAVANEEEIEYLVACVRQVLPAAGFSRCDIAWHYSGVRPLPRVDARSPAGITRRHSLIAHEEAPCPVFSVVGGKLTTCRSLAEETASAVFKRIGWRVEQTSRERPIPGATGFPVEAAKHAAVLAEFSRETGLSLEQSAALWNLWGTTAGAVANFCQGGQAVSLAGTHLPRGAVRYCLEHEWAATLDDLVERRLMLLYEPGLSRETLRDLAEEMLSANRLKPAEQSGAIAATLRRLESHFGLRFLARRQSDLNIGSSSIERKHPLRELLLMHILALDQGTTSSRALIFDQRGQIVSLAQEEFEQILPRPGWVEHDPEVIWGTQLAVARKAMRQVGLSATEIAGIGVTNQRETTILWERDTGRPIANAIVWQSRASADICERMKREGLEATFREKTGLVLDAYFSGSKIRHLFDTYPGLQQRAEQGEILFGTVDCFLLWRLTGGKVHATDVSNASRTLLFNIHTLDWDDELLALFGVPRAMLPQTRPSSGIFGETDPLLFGAAIPITGVAGDQQAATFGQACFSPGMAKNTYGTGCFLLMNTGERPIPSRNNLLTTIGWQIGERVTYCLEGSVFVAGAVVTWLRDGLRMIESSREIEALAASVPDTAGVAFVPALVGLGAPYWDPFARGLIIGLTRGTQQGHIARAALESMALQAGDVLRAMQDDSGLPLEKLQVDGGAAQNDLLMQFQADILDVRVLRPNTFESTASGVAYLAGLAVGVWADLDEVARCWSVQAEFTPHMPSDERAARWRQWHRAVERSRGWASEEQP